MGNEGKMITVMRTILLMIVHKGVGSSRLKDC